MAWLPTYFTDTLSLTLSQAAQVSLLPPIASIAASALAGDPRAVPAGSQALHALDV